MDLAQAQSQQLQIFSSAEKVSKSQRLMQVLDATNAAMGHKTLYLAAEGRNETWKVKSEHRTPAYTTCWDSFADREGVIGPEVAARKTLLARSHVEWRARVILSFHLPGRVLRCCCTAP